MEMYKPSYELESKTATPGLKLIFQLAGLPKGNRCSHIQLEIEGTVTNNSSGSSVAVYVQQLARMIAQLYLKSPLAEIRTTGRKMWVDYRHMMGKTLNNTAQTLTNGGGTGVFRLCLPLYFSDPHAFSPNDCAQPAELLEGKTIEIQCASSFTVGTGGSSTQVLSGVTVRVVMYFIPGNSDVDDKALPSALMIDYEDWNQADAFLKVGGAFPYLAIYDENDDEVDTAAFERVRVQLDGQETVDRLRCVALIHDYNDRKAVGGAASAVGTDGIAETEQLAVTGHTLFIPVLTAPEKYKSMQLPEAEKTARATISSGTATGARWSYRLIRDIGPDSAEMIEAARLMGIKQPDRAEFSSKTASKTSLQGQPHRVAKAERRLPKRVKGI